MREPEPSHLVRREERGLLLGSRSRQKSFKLGDFGKGKMVGENGNDDRKYVGMFSIVSGSGHRQESGRKLEPALKMREGDGG